jgi:hypothetical protein
MRFSSFGQLGCVPGGGMPRRRQQIPSSVEGAQTFVIVTTPQTGIRIPPRISVAVG